MRRWAVVGDAGSGKTVLAVRLSVMLDIPHVELDAIHWEIGWIPRPQGEFADAVERATRGEAWVVDGNYSKVRHIVWGRAQAVVWLDYALPIVLGRLLRRTARRVLTREVLWNGNRETWRGAFLDPDNLFGYVLRTHDERRRGIRRALALPQYTHLELVHLRRPSDAEHWRDRR